MKRKRYIFTMFLCLMFLVGFLAYKNFSVRSIDSKTIQKTSAGLSAEEYKKVKQELLDLLNDRDPKIALAELHERVKTDDTLLRSCHILTHDLGHAAYLKYGNFGEAMKFQDEICNSGYIHGIVESYFSQSTDALTAMKTVCGAYPEGKFLSWECYHGVGHGLMLFTQNDLPKSLKLCGEYHTDFAKSTCINGVFMENFNTDGNLHPSAFLKKTNLFYPCEEQKSSDKAPCYLYAPTYYLSLHKNDYIGALKWCNGAELLYGETCAEGVGTQAMKENINDVTLVEQICMSAPALKTASCFGGMTSLYINHYGSLESAQKMCGQLKEQNRQFCYDTVRSRASLFN